MTDQTGGHWYLREGGAVTSAAWNVADPVPMLRHNAYAKSWRGEPLSEAEQAALDSAPPVWLGAVAGNMVGDALLGMIARHKPEALEAIDRIADDLAEGLGLAPHLVWHGLADYAARALAVVQAEAFADPLTLSPEDEARQVAEAGAWEDSEEGRRAIEAAAPDGGPEGWSQVPPLNPAHPLHPDNREA